MTYNIKDIDGYCSYSLAESKREIDPFTELCEKIWEAVCLFFTETYSYFFGPSIQSESLLKEALQIESVAKEAKELNYSPRSITSYVDLHFQILALKHQKEKEALEEKRSLLIRKVGNETLIDTIVKNFISKLKELPQTVFENSALDHKEIIRAIKTKMGNPTQEMIQEIQKTRRFACKQFGIDYNTWEKAEISFQFERLLSSLKINDKYKKNAYKIYRQANEKILEKVEKKKLSIAEESLNECYQNLGIAEDIQRCIQIHSDYKAVLLKIEQNFNGDEREKEIARAHSHWSQNTNPLEQQAVKYELDLFNEEVTNKYFKKQF